MKRKLLGIVAIILGLILLSNPVLAANTHSIDLESTSSQYLSVADHADWETSSDFTFTTWIRFESDPAGLDQTFFSRRVAAGNNRVYHFYFDSASTVILETWTDGTTAGCGVNFSWNPTTATWYHVALIKEGKAAKLFIDNSIVSTQTCSNGTVYTGANTPLELGAWSTGSHYVDGLMDDIRFYTNAIATTSVTSIYNCQDTTVETAKGWWKLDNDLTDSSGNGHTLTNNNAAVFSTTIPSQTCPATFLPSDGGNMIISSGLFMVLGILPERKKWK